MEQIEIRTFLETMKSELKAELKAQNTVIDLVIIPKLNESIAHGEKTNGRVTHLEKIVNPLEWISKHKILSLIIFTAFWFVLDWASAHVNIEKTVSNKTGIEFSQNKFLNDSI